MEKEIKAWIEAASKKLSINLDLLFGSNRKIELPNRSYLFKKIELEERLMDNLIKKLLEEQKRLEEIEDKIMRNKILEKLCIKEIK